MQTNHFMIDIESLDLKPSTIILAIGAVKFDPQTLTVSTEHRFHKRISISSQPHRSMSPSTLSWWFSQPLALMKDNISGDQPLNEVLGEFSRFLGTAPVVWAKGVMFDISALEHAYHQEAIALPWNFRSVSCMRTLSNLLPPTFELARDPAHPAHDALHDAIHQAKWVCAALRAIRGETK